MTRSRYLPARTRRALAEQEGCTECGDPGTYERDHIVPHALGGSNEPDNLQRLCPKHHKVKTKRDRRMIDKADRVKAKREGTWIGKRSRPMRSRGFQNRAVAHQWPKRKMQSRGWT